MATATKKKPGTAVATWDEQLAKDAAIAASMEEGVASGQFISLKSGVLSWNDSPMKDNQMAVIILDSILENVFYEGAYDPDVPQGPICFAFGREEKTMAPHKLVVEASNQQCGASGLCQGCEKNEFGSADTGRGKACRNTRRLALIPAGSFDNGRFKLLDDVEHFEKTVIGFMKLPVTSIKGYAAFVKQVAGTLKRPPHGIVTRIRVVPDAATQFKVLFEAIENVPNELMGVVMARHDEAMSVIDFPYTPFEEEATTAKRGSRAVKQPVKKVAAKRRY